jgi:hypothetical protein
MAEKIILSFKTVQSKMVAYGGFFFKHCLVRWMNMAVSFSKIA